MGIEIGIKAGKIAALGYALEAGSSTEIIDAEGAYVTPGSVMTIVKSNYQYLQVTVALILMHMSNKTTHQLGILGKPEADLQLLEAIPQSLLSRPRNVMKIAYGLH